MEDKTVSIAYFMTKDIDLMSTDSMGRTPLHWSAISISVLPVSTHLILTTQSGKNFCVNHQDKQGNTPLHLAVSHYNLSKSTIPIRILLRKKADMKIKNNDGKTPRDLAKDLAKFHKDSSEKVISILNEFDTNRVHLELTKAR